MALSDVSNILWRERWLLELLVFKLEVEQLVLAAGRARGLAYATREVESVLGETRHIGLERSVLVAGTARELGRSGSPTLRELAGFSPPPWDGIFAEHRSAMLTLAQEIDSVTKSNRALIRRRSDQRRLSTMEATLRGDPRFLRDRATQSQSTSSGLTMRQDMTDIEVQVMVQLPTRQIASQAVLAAGARAVQPSLTDFLK